MYPVPFLALWMACERHRLRDNMGQCRRLSSNEHVWFSVRASAVCDHMGCGRFAAVAVPLYGRNAHTAE